MSEPKLISPLLDNFIMGDPISNHNGIRCCPAMNNDTGDKYIIKIISVPASPTQLDALMLTGALANEEEAKKYVEERTNALVKEIESLQQLSRQEGFLPYSAYQVVPMEDTIGFDIYILTEYRRSLDRQFTKKPLSQLDAMNLGLDICSALTACRRSGLLFINLKPNNIFITDNGEYKISDLGFLNLNSLKYASIPEHDIGSYTAPEIQDAFSSPNNTIDVYALGMILYEIFNGGVLPERGQTSLPAPQYADEELSQIILKACDPDPQNRWQDPAQMGQMLVSYMQKNGVFDIPIVPEVEPEIAEETENTDIPQAQEEVITDLPVEEDLPIETDDIIAEVDSLIPDEEILEDESEETFQDAEEGDPIVEIPVVPQELTAPDEECNDDPSTEELSDENASKEPASVEETTLEQSNYSDSSDEAITNDISESTETVVVQSQKTPYEDISIEVSEILYQADMLAAMEVPEPVIAPEPTQILIPETETNNSEHQADSQNEENDADASAEEQPTEEENQPINDLEADMAPITPKKANWIRATIIVLLFVFLIVGGFLFFNFFVIKSIDNLEIIGNKDKLTVKITSEADDSMLTVSCKDTYGKIVTLPVVNDTVEFSDLLPNADYSITVNITGFHILTGKTTGNYFTPLKTTVTDCKVDITDTAGSAILTFNVTGPDSKQWKLTYSAQGQQEMTAIFDGHSHVITGLQEKEIYTGYLEPVDDLFIDEPQPIIFTANELIQANNVQIVSCAGGKLRVKWDAPKSVAVSGWSVRCYNDATYEKTIPIKSTYAEFDVPDCSDSYTVEVIADGQKASQKDRIEKNTVTISSIYPDPSVNGMIKLEWQSESTPAKGWIVTYGVNGSDKTMTVTANEKTAQISPVVPGAKYTFTVYSADAVETLVEEISCNTPAAQDLSLTVGETKYQKNDFQFSLCTRPQTGNWTESDTSVTYTESFSPNQAAGFIVFLKEKAEDANDALQVSFIIMDEQNQLVVAENSTLTWNTMWSNGKCSLNIPTMPTASGYYTISVYFNAQLAFTQSFIIQ